ncbi:hypothetical protein BJX99DRAFT_253329 [Aspergillus californicus]
MASPSPSPSPAQPQAQSTYPAYLVTETSLSPRPHVFIFIETNEDGPSTGHRFHVIGNIQEGMTFNHRTCLKPEDENEFEAKEKLGTVSVADYEGGKMLSICEEIEVPKKQFQGPKRLFPGEKLRRCGEWAKEAVELLGERGVLVRNGNC